MNVLLDTCALLALSRGELPERAAHALRAAPEANVSVVGAWEVALKAAAGKLRLGEPPAHRLDALMTRHRLRELPLDVKQCFWPPPRRQRRSSRAIRIAVAAMRITCCARR